MGGIGMGSDPNGFADSPGGEPAASVDEVNGPTVTLNYDIQTSVKTPITSFMYFVPLISPTLVEMEIDGNNQQQTRIVSYKRSVTPNSFHVICEFEMAGKGFYKNTFDAAEVIAICADGLKKGVPMTNVLDYIKFEGEGLGSVEVRGTISGSTETVTEVDVHFNLKGRKSPVTIGLYSIAPEDGKYKYENRYNEIIARVATLTFKKCEGEPRMGVKVVSINKATNPNGFMGRIKGVIANWFIEPPRVSKIGNDTMLNFGYALMKEKPAFTFPRAKNLKKTRMAAIDNNKN
ncbi:MAG: hypothetical protein ABSG82_04225 [Sedimentisphaerales bacterium]